MPGGRLILALTFPTRSPDTTSRSAPTGQHSTTWPRAFASRTQAIPYLPLGAAGTSSATAPIPPTPSTL